MTRIPSRKKNATRTSKNVPVLLARASYGGRIDDRHQVLNVIDQDPVEQSLIPILKSYHEDISLQIVRLRTETFQSSSDLFLLGTDPGRKQSAKRQCVPFLFRERDSLV